MGELDFSDYQRRAARTGGAVEVNHPIVYPTLGLTNEAGEVAGKVKKIFRDRGGVVSEDDRVALTLELGDVLGTSPSSAHNSESISMTRQRRTFASLKTGQTRGRLSGDGDYR